MSDQNIYDDTAFFEGYKKIRNNPKSYNNMIEKPALFSLCPDFRGMQVLDLGCGYGENCKEFKRLGATYVVGIDISKKMLEVAKKENKENGIDYLGMSMDDISLLNQKFDIIISSLAIHYVEDFNKLIENVSNLLNKGGYFIFSQEHPLTTAPKTDNYWSEDASGNVSHYNLSDYGMQGKREIEWIVKGVIKYHRSFETILNTLISKGFSIEKVLEPIPDENLARDFPCFKRNYHKPEFLFIKTKKE